MLILGIDTSCACAKVALLKDGRVLGTSYADDMKTHSVKLMPMVDEVLKSNNVLPADLNLIGVVTGPGSFTGLRIGVTTAKAIAYAADTKLVGVNTLDFLAASVSEKDVLICPVVDARNTNVYCNAYENGSPLWECEVLSSECLAKKLKDLNKEVVFTGDGAEKYFEIYRDILGDLCKTAPANEIKGRAEVLCYITEKKQAEAENAFELQVNYYRITQAERMKNGGN